MENLPRHKSARKADNTQPTDVHACVDTVEIWPFIDTVEVFFPRHANRQEIARHGWVEACLTRHGELIGYRLIRNQPGQAWLKEMDQLAARYHGVLHRVDVALEMAPTPGLYEHIRNKAVLKWSRSFACERSAARSTGWT